MIENNYMHMIEHCNECGGDTDNHKKKCSRHPTNVRITTSCTSTYGPSYIWTTDGNGKLISGKRPTGESFVFYDLSTGKQQIRSSHLDL